MTTQDEQRLLCLECRARHLEDRIRLARPRALSYDEAELSALTWAIAFIRGALDGEAER